MNTELDNYDDEIEDATEESNSFVGKFFLLRECYWSEQGTMVQGGYAGVVKAAVGSTHHLIQSCRGQHIQKVVPTEFFIEGRALIFDTFEELKEAIQRRK
jgi:hypothetical protein